MLRDFTPTSTKVVSVDAGVGEDASENWLKAATRCKSPIFRLQARIQRPDALVQFEFPKQQIKLAPRFRRPEHSNTKPKPLCMDNLEMHLLADPDN